MHPVAPAAAGSGQSRLDGRHSCSRTQPGAHTHPPQLSKQTHPRATRALGLPAGEGAVLVLQGQFSLLQLNNEPGEVFRGPVGQEHILSANGFLEGTWMCVLGGRQKPCQQLMSHRPGQVPRALSHSTGSNHSPLPATAHQGNDFYKPWFYFTCKNRVDMQQSVCHYAEATKGCLRAPARHVAQRRGSVHFCLLSSLLLQSPHKQQHNSKSNHNRCQHVQRFVTFKTILDYLS